MRVLQHSIADIYNRIPELLEDHVKLQSLNHYFSERMDLIELGGHPVKITPLHF